MIKIIIFLLGFLSGAVTLIVWACLIVGAEADEKERQMFEEHIKEKKENDE